MKLFWSIFAASLVVAAGTAEALALPAAGWVVTNWSANDPSLLPLQGAATDSPSVTGAGGFVLMNGLPQFNLNDGEGVLATASMTVVESQGFRPIQFRIGLFHEEGAAPTTGDGVGYTGFTIENDGTLKETAGPSNPFSSAGATFVALGIDSENDMLTASTFTIQFTLAVLRDGDQFDVNGRITDGDQYDERFVIDDYDPTNLGFSYNRVGFLVGQTVTLSSMRLDNVTVTSIPEPGAGLLSVLAIGGVAAGFVAGRSRSWRWSCAG